MRSCLPARRSTRPPGSGRRAPWSAPAARAGRRRGRSPNRRPRVRSGGLRQSLGPHPPTPSPVATGEGEQTLLSTLSALGGRRIPRETGGRKGRVRVVAASTSTVSGFGERIERIDALPSHTLVPIRAIRSRNSLTVPCCAALHGSSRRRRSHWHQSVSSAPKIR